jgi:DNA-binding beta-propeller fold protein YncE
MLATTATLTGNITFTGTGYAAGRSITIRVVNGGTLRTIGFPAGWVFVGLKPTDIAANKTGVLTVTAFSTTEASCVATWVVQT